MTQENQSEAQDTVKTESEQGTQPEGQTEGEGTKTEESGAAQTG